MKENTTMRSLSVCVAMLLAPFFFFDRGANAAEAPSAPAAAAAPAQAGKNIVAIRAGKLIDVVNSRVVVD